MSEEGFNAAPSREEVLGHFQGIINQTDPAIVDEQIALGVTVESQGGNFFNNFIGNMPGGVWRSMVERQNAYDSSLVFPSESVDESKPLSLSTYARQRTFRQFFGDIDQAIEAAGLSLEQIQDFQQRMLQAQEAGRLHEAHLVGIAYSRYVVPVYRALRLQGYSHGDLQR